MPRVKQQHFVPQFYLKQFTTNSKRLFVFDKLRKKSFPANVNTTASRAGFYDWAQETVDEMLQDLEQQKLKTSASGLKGLEQTINILRERQTQLVEGHLAQLESHFGKVYRELLRQLDENGAPNFSDESRAEISFYLALQFLRTMEHREYITEMFNKGATAVSKMMFRVAKAHNQPDVTNIPSDVFDNVTIEYDEAAIKLHHTMLLLDFERVVQIAEILRTHIWWVGLNKTPYPFWTSDNPVVKCEHKKEPFKSNLGLGSAGIEIAFPLTPKYILVLADRTYHRNFASLDGQTSRLT